MTGKSGAAGHAYIFILHREVFKVNSFLDLWTRRKYNQIKLKNTGNMARTAQNRQRFLL